LFALINVEHEFHRGLIGKFLARAIHPDP
jgi:hypothetical protein